ncbi:PaaI family thioesterase [bacterium]|nr:PaaI family thioesterase [bacterium]
MNPADYGLPAGWQHWPSDPAEDRIGPFFFSQVGDGAQSALKVEAHHCNTFGVVHGGVLLALADYTLCLAGMDNTEQGCATVSLSSEFLAPAEAGQALRGVGIRTRTGRKLRFVRAEIRADDELIMTASAVLKVSHPK